MITGWRSKAGWAGKAHLVLEDGRTACADRSGPRGIRIGDLLQCAWTERRPTDHLCGFCQRVAPTLCTCGRCSAEATRKATAS